MAGRARLPSTARGAFARCHSSNFQPARAREAGLARPSRILSSFSLALFFGSVLAHSLAVFRNRVQQSHVLHFTAFCFLPIITSIILAQLHISVCGARFVHCSSKPQFFYDTLVFCKCTVVLQFNSKMFLSFEKKRFRQQASCLQQSCSCNATSLQVLFACALYLVPLVYLLPSCASELITDECQRLARFMRAAFSSYLYASCSRYAVNATPGKCKVLEITSNKAIIVRCSPA